MYVQQFVSDSKAREKPCVRCGLSLRKHLDERHCPECGLSVWMTLNGNDALDYSNPHWLTRAARGAWVMAAIQVLALVAYLLGMSAVAADAFRSFDLDRPSVATTTQTAAIDEDTEEERSEPVSPLLIAALAICGVYFVCDGCGLVLLTANERRFPDRMKQIRLAARGMAGIATAVGAGLLALAAFHGFGHHLMSGIESWLLLLLIEVTFAVGAFVSWFWVRSVLRRAGRSGLAKLCGYLLFLPVIPFLKAAPFIGLWMFYVISPLLHFLPLAYLPLSIYLYSRSAWLLRSAIPHAEEAWQRESASPAAVPG
ncbi:MAG: hypothetical protein QM754_14870 [Tepidisphaeraceae bacterium]